MHPIRLFIHGILTSSLSWRRPRASAVTKKESEACIVHYVNSNKHDCRGKWTNERENAATGLFLRRNCRDESTPAPDITPSAPF